MISINKKTTRMMMTVAALMGSLKIAQVDGAEPGARAYEPSVQESIATFDSVGMKTVPTTVAADANEVDTIAAASNEEDGIEEVQAELSRLCMDDLSLQYKHLVRSKGQVDLKNCAWVAAKPMVRCNFQLEEDGNLFLRDFCPRSCGLCPEATQIIPCPEVDLTPAAPTPSPTPTNTGTTSLGSSSDGTTSSSFGSTLDPGAAMVDNKESSVNDGNNKSLAITLSVIPLFLLLLLLLYCCCYRKTREGKNYEDDTDEENNYPIHKTKSTQSQGSRLIGFVVSTFNGRKKDPQVDVRKCTSAVCEACEEEVDVRKVRSIDTYERERQERENDQC